MGREKAWQKANEAQMLAKELYVEKASRGMLGRGDPNAEMYYILALIAGSIKELTLPDGPIHLQDLKFGIGDEWWK